MRSKWLLTEKALVFVLPNRDRRGGVWKSRMLKAEGLLQPESSNRWSKIQTKIGTGNQVPDRIYPYVYFGFPDR